MKTAIGVGLTTDENWDEFSTYVIEAERMGVDSVWSAEAWGHDGATPLGYLAAKTSRIKLGSGILQTVGPHAREHGDDGDDAAIDVGRALPARPRRQRAAGGGGLARRALHAPIRRLREVIDIVRLISSGEKSAYEGEIFQLPLPGGEGKAIRSRAKPQPNIPVYLATLSPNSLELTGEVADGWLGTSFMPEHADVFFDHIKRGAQKAGRTLADIDLAVGGAVAFSDDVDKLIARNKPGIAFTLGAMGSKNHNFYNAAFRRAGYDEEALAVQRLWLEGDREGAAKLVPDEMVTQVNLLGTEEMVRERIRKYREAGVTTLRLQPEGRTLEERLETLGRTVDLVKEVSKEPAAAR